MPQLLERSKHNFLFDERENTPKRHQNQNTRQTPIGTTPRSLYDWTLFQALSQYHHHKKTTFFLMKNRKIPQQHQNQNTPQRRVTNLASKHTVLFPLCGHHNTHNTTNIPWVLNSWLGCFATFSPPSHPMPTIRPPFWLAPCDELIFHWAEQATFEAIVFHNVTTMWPQLELSTSLIQRRGKHSMKRFYDEAIFGPLATGLFCFEAMMLVSPWSKDTVFPRASRSR
jgi:hypothetical protein